MKGLCPLPHYNADRAQMAVYWKKSDFIYRAKRNKPVRASDTSNF